MSPALGPSVPAPRQLDQTAIVAIQQRILQAAPRLLGLDYGERVGANGLAGG